MSWTFGNWQDFLKKKACRYILQHYLGQFLKQKLSLDQLSLDLYNGTGKITDLNLDVQVNYVNRVNHEYDIFQNHLAIFENDESI